MPFTSGSILALHERRSLERAVLGWSQSGSVKKCVTSRWHSADPAANGGRNNRRGQPLPRVVAGSYQRCCPGRQARAEADRKPEGMFSSPALRGGRFGCANSQRCLGVQVDRWKCKCCCREGDRSGVSRQSVSHINATDYDVIVPGIGCRAWAGNHRTVDFLRGQKAIDSE